MLEPLARRWPQRRLRRGWDRASASLCLGVCSAAHAADPATPTPLRPAITSDSASLVGWLLLTAVLAALVLGLATVCAGLHRRQRLHAEALRRSRAESQALAGVLDVWHWRSDRTHRLAWLRPPVGSDSSAWAGGMAQAAQAAPGSQPSQVSVWQTFQAEDLSALRSRVEAGDSLNDVPVSFGAEPDTLRAGLLRASPLLDAEGQFDGHVGTLRETAARAAPLPSAAPASTAAAVPAVADADVNDSESFSYTVSHDLRAPIRVVEGFTKILKEDYGRLLDRIGNDHLDRVLGAAARMNSMIDALLALSQLSARPLSRQPVNLSQLATYVADDLRRQWPQREVELHIEPGMQVHGDPTLLRVVLENLLGNAWKYTGKCQQALIHFERDAQAPATTFTVRDNGAGFDMRFADRLFGVFQRLHSANDFQGTGVGLASVRRIIRRHGGEFWAESEVDRGAAFYFTLGNGAR